MQPQSSVCRPTHTVYHTSGAVYNHSEESADKFTCRETPQHVAQRVIPSLCPTGAKYTFTIKEGADGKNGRISVNYDGFIDDVGVNDMLLVDGGMLSLKILEKTKQDVVCEVVDGGVMGSRYIFYYILYSL